MSDTKKKEYEMLVAEVQDCTECDKHKKEIKKEPVILEHDTKRRKINLWAEWQGSLDADILLIGQDWGRLADKDNRLIGECFARDVEKKIDSKKIYYGYIEEESYTNSHLAELFKELDICVEKEDPRLFFTNSVLCYKTGSLSNPVNEEWFRECNKKHMYRLIHIIRPKVIITVGKIALLSLGDCLNFKGFFKPGELENPLGKSYFKSFNKVLDNGAIYILLDGIGFIPVCPVSHTGTLATNLNRNKDEQLKDWQKINALYKSILKEEQCNN